MVKKTVTEKQLQANRRNSQRSTGPRTEEGKHHSSRNALQHGIFSSTVVITVGPNAENPEEYQNLLHGMMNYWRPIGTMEVELVRDMTDTIWRRARCKQFEIGGLMRARARERERVAREECDSVRRGEGRSTSRTTLGMQLVKATIADSVDQLNNGGALSDDIITDIQKFFPADFADDFVTDNRILVALKTEDTPTNIANYKMVRDRMIVKLKELPVDKWQQAADERHGYQETMTVYLSSIPDEKVIEAVLRYETALNRQLASTIAQLVLLQRLREENPKSAIHDVPIGDQDHAF